MPSITALSNHILTVAMVLWGTLPMGYRVETPPIGHYREYLLPPTHTTKGHCPKLSSYLHQRTYGRFTYGGHREYKLTFRGIILILCYKVVPSSESW